MSEHRRSLDDLNRTAVAAKPHADEWAAERSVPEGTGWDAHRCGRDEPTLAFWPGERPRAVRSIADWLDQIHVGDCLDLLKKLPDQSVNLVITSPPYFQQRKYTEDPREIGREEEVGDYVDALYEVFEQCVRVTRDDGSIILNLGDKYIKGSLALIPYRFAIKVQEKHKAVRLINDVTWAKTNPTPRQYAGRMVSATEPFFHFVKGKGYKYRPERLSGTSVQKRAKPGSKVGARYFKQIDESDLSPEQRTLARKELTGAIEQVRSGDLAGFRMRINGIHPLPFGGQDGGRKTQMLNKGYTIIRHPGGSLVKDWVECRVETIKGIKHPAVFPKALVERFITLTTDIDDICLDPFMGSGSTAMACRGLDRRFIGMELNEEYAAEARKRIAALGEGTMSADRRHPELAEGSVRSGITGSRGPEGRRSAHSGASPALCQSA